jgi:hypothetical protein
MLALRFEASHNRSSNCRAITAIILSSTLLNSALSLSSDLGVGDKGGERIVVGLDAGRGHRLTRSVDT